MQSSAAPNPRSHGDARPENGQQLQLEHRDARPRLEPAMRTIRTQTRELTNDVIVKAPAPICRILRVITVINESDERENEHEEGKNAHPDDVGANFAARVDGDYFPALDFHPDQEDQSAGDYIAGYRHKGG